MDRLAPPNFVLQFQPAELEKWASKYFAHPKYNAQKERMAEITADKAKEQGFMTKKDFLTVVEWKAARSKGYAAKNDPDDIREATQIAFSSPHARVRFGVLMTLSGVAYPMASAILHLVCKDVPLLDVNALAALGVEKPPSYNFIFWNAYCSFVLTIAEKSALSLRTIDRALWAYGEENRIE
jgi:hypothetical protein